MNEDKCEECGYYGNYCDGYSLFCKDSKDDKNVEIKGNQNLLEL